MRYDFAPLEGVTGYVYRNLHRSHFGGADRYFMPFISANQSMAFSRKEWQDICQEHNGAQDLVPQILGKDADAFLWAARALRELGYEEINFNLGCPSGMVCAPSWIRCFLRWMAPFPLKRAWALQRRRSLRRF